VGAVLKPFNADFGTNVTLWFTTGGALGLEENGIPEPELAIYPNPTQGNANLNITIGKPAEMRIRIYNSVGQLVEEMIPGTHSSLQLELPKEPAGLYFVHVAAGSFNRTMRWVVTR